MWIIGSVSRTCNYRRVLLREKDWMVSLMKSTSTLRLFCNEFIHYQEHLSNSNWVFKTQVLIFIITPTVFTRQSYKYVNGIYRWFFFFSSRNVIDNDEYEITIMIISTNVLDRYNIVTRAFFSLFLLFKYELWTIIYIYKLFFHKWNLTGILQEVV